MEFKMNKVQLPEKISFNYEELKHELQERASLYEAMVYGEEEIKQAKADKANMNKLKKALNDERIRQEKEYMKPFNEFKSQVNEIIKIIDVPILCIDKQIKTYEEKQKAEKKDKILTYWNGLVRYEWLNIGQIWDDRWLNATVSMKKIQDEIAEKLERIEADIKTIEALPEFSFEAAETYKHSLDLNRAISEGQRLADIQKRKAEAEAARQAAEAEKDRLQAEAGTQEANVTVNVKTPEGIEMPIGNVKVEIPLKQWIGFEALLSVDDAKELRAFFTQKNIEFRMI